ncbi:MAG: hypothetical protein AAB383_06045 [Patescibacteria group bacterium]
MKRKILISSLVLFVVLMTLSILLFRYDDRPSDGNLTYGFPFPIYYKTAGFGGPETSGLVLFGLTIDVLIFYAVSLVSSYTFFRVRER